MICRKFFFALVAAGTSVLGIRAAEPVLWMRNPSISPDGTRIAFTYKGDVYSVPSVGGMATRLTTQESYEAFPIWSPDGKSIVFTSDRQSRGVQLYIIPASGGVARQLTTHTADKEPYTFSPDGRYIVFKSHIQDPASSALFPSVRITELYRVPAEGGAIEQILATPAEAVRISPDGRYYLYQDVHGVEDPWRKHHTSSVTRDIVEYDTSTKQYRYVVKHAGEDREPVYSPDGKNIYFLSERDGGSMNVYQTARLGSGEVRALTHFTTEPVRSLSSSRDGLLCFSYGGELYTLEPGHRPKKVSVDLVSDQDTKEDISLGIGSRMWSAVVSPDGKQVAYLSRGEVFVTSADYKTTKRITHTAAEENWLAFAPDGRSLVYASCRDGLWGLYKASIVRDEELYFPNATAIKEEKFLGQLSGEKTQPSYAPKGNELAFVLDRRKLMVYNIGNQTVRQITDDSASQDLTGSMYYEWSPDAQWFVISYTPRRHTPYTDVGIVSAKGGEQVHNITNSGYRSSTPHWSLDGKAITYLTEHYGMRNHASWGSLVDVMAVYLNRAAFEEASLNEEQYDLYQEVKKRAEKKAEVTKTSSTLTKDTSADTMATEHKFARVQIEWDGLEDRVVRLTPTSSDISDALLTADGAKLYYLSASDKGYDLWVRDMRNKRNKLVQALDLGYSWLGTQRNGKQLFILGSATKKFDVKTPTIKDIASATVAEIDRAKEREAMFAEIEREEAKRFYRVDMHGVDWHKLCGIYRRYLPHINNNYDFAIMASELLGELNVSHTGCRFREPAPAFPTAELGLFYHRERGRSGLIIDEVVAGGPCDKSYLTLLPGDIVLSIDGVTIEDGKDFYSALAGKSGKSVLLVYQSSRDRKLSEAVVVPISATALNKLLYNRWVKQRAEEVDKLSGGKLGYVHIPSMGDPSFRTVYSEALGRYFDREGIVVDIRYNGGGRLHEDLEVFFSGKKYLEQVVRDQVYGTMPSRRWSRPSVMLTCEADYSNAHGSPWVYQKMGLGKVVGMPVAGTMTSVNWVTLQDPSLYYGIPSVGFRTPEGQYLENTELQPDVVAPLDYNEAIRGIDTQIRRSVEVLKQEVRATSK